MSDLLDILKQLLPLWAVLLLVGFGYLVLLFKRAADAFLTIAKQQSEYMKDRVDVVDKSTGIFTRTIDQQEKEIKRLQEQLQRIGAELQSTRETDARLSVQELTLLAGQIAKLSAAQEEIFHLIGHTTMSPSLHSPESSIGDLPSAVGGDIGRAIRARDLSVYPVLVLNVDGAPGLVKRLQNAGYAASLYESEYHIKSSDDHQEGIWVGAMIPPGNVVEIISIAREEWPHLKYVHLSTDTDGPDEVHYRMFIGGSSQSARGHLNCAPWTDEDFSALSSGFSYSELHAFIRARYR